MAEARHSWIMEVRARLETPKPKRLPTSEAREAAVLVPLYVDAGALWTVLTKRSETLPHHQSQIAFPGGGLEPGETHWGAAVRETEEEIGIGAGTVMRLGDLDELSTPSGFRIVPCVGAIRYPYETRINEAEIAEVFAVPLMEFANVRIVEDRVVRIDGKERALRVYHVAGRQVWGLTARVLQNLMQRLGLEGLPAPE
jgi:8-oxo-dGTP pyrophosphatase MutT (NUDIX family)